MTFAEQMGNQRSFQIALAISFIRKPLGETMAYN
jgi:hypothetical protein